MAETIFAMLFSLLLSHTYAHAKLGLLGHLEPLGKQRPSEGHIQTLSTVPAGDEFFDKYLLPGRPVVFKGAAKEIPAYKLWTDEYLKDKFGSEITAAEVGKKERIPLRAYHFSVREFMERYKAENIYMVYSVPEIMRADLCLLPCMSCGGYINLLQDVVLWFSSGGTKSVFHNDAFDNIICQLSGTKDLYMVDKIYESQAHIDDTRAAYSLLDVEAVNLTKYPNIAKIPWYRARVESGDCLFIPFKWLHQVQSYGRNLAVNVWFSHVKRIDINDCQKREKKYLSMSGVNFKPIDGMRNMLLIELEAKEDRMLTRRDILEFIKETGVNVSKDLLQEIWKVLDKVRNRRVSRNELISMTVKDLEVLSSVTGMFDRGKRDERHEQEEERNQDVGDHCDAEAENQVEKEKGKMQEKKKLEAKIDKKEKRGYLSDNEEL